MVLHRLSAALRSLLNALGRPESFKTATFIVPLLAIAPVTAQAQDASYSGAGRLIQAQPLAGAPDGASAYRILYQSTGLRGEPITVSGMVIAPPGPAPDGGRPVVAWAHPTTGVVERCAPSLARKRFQMIAGLRLMLARGYVVAATDYPGLGTPEVHPYLVGESEGRAVLDSVPGQARLSRFGVILRAVRRRFSPACSHIAMRRSCGSSALPPRRRRLSSRL
jgi:hypothetical protein